MPVDKALDLLNFSPKKGAEIIKKVLESAIANAEHNDGADIDELKVKTIFVEKGHNHEDTFMKIEEVYSTQIFRDDKH